MGSADQLVSSWWSLKESYRALRAVIHFHSSSVISHRLANLAREHFKSLWSILRHWTVSWYNIINRLGSNIYPIVPASKVPLHWIATHAQTDHILVIIHISREWWWSSSILPGKILKYSTAVVNIVWKISDHISVNYQSCTTLFYLPQVSFSAWTMTS